MPKRKRTMYAGGPKPKYRKYHPGLTAGALIKRQQRTAGFLGIETKFFDVEADQDAFAVSWATMEPATTNLTAVAQGDGESNRDGRRYAIKSIHLKGHVEAPAVESNPAPVPDQLTRICLVWDTQTNGAQLTATDVMDGGQTVDVLSFRNLQFTKRFRVLYDKTIMLPVGTANTNEGSINLFANALIRRSFKFNKTFDPPIQVTMSGTGADIANVTDNSIHMIGVSVTTLPTLTYQCRIRFVG